MDKPIDGSSPTAEQPLGIEYERVIHLTANLMSEDVARNLRSVFKGTMSIEDFRKTLKPNENVCMEQIAAIHGVVIAEIPES